MKLRLSFLPLFAVLLLSGALFTSCTQTNNPPGTTTGYHDTFADVSGLNPGTTYQFSLSGNASSTFISGVSSYTTGTVRVYWTRGSGDTSLIVPTAVAGNTASSNTIVWAAVTGGGTFRLFETADPTSSDNSGLILGPTPHTASLSGAEKSKIDLVLKTEKSISLPQLSLVSADVNGTNTRMADFGFVPAAKSNYYKGGLAAQAFASGSLSSLIPAGANNFFDIDPAKFDSSSAIVLIRTADNHYARVEIIPQGITVFNGVSGRFLWGDTNPSNPALSYRFIDVNVTYNPTVGSAYAAIFNPKNSLLAFAGESSSFIH